MIPKGIIKRTRARTPKLNVPRNEAIPTARTLFQTTHHQPAGVSNPTWLNASPSPPVRRSRLTQSAGSVKRLARLLPMKNPPANTADVIPAGGASFLRVDLIRPRYHSDTESAPPLNDSANILQAQRKSTTS